MLLNPQDIEKALVEKLGSGVNLNQIKRADLLNIPDATYKQAQEGLKIEPPALQKRWADWHSAQKNTYEIFPVNTGIRALALDEDTYPHAHELRLALDAGAVERGISLTYEESHSYGTLWGVEHASAGILRVIVPSKALETHTETKWQRDKGNIWHPLAANFNPDKWEAFKTDDGEFIGHFHTDGLTLCLDTAPKNKADAERLGKELFAAVEKAKHRLIVISPDQNQQAMIVAACEHFDKIAMLLKTQLDLLGQKEADTRKLVDELDRKVKDTQRQMAQLLRQQATEKKMLQMLSSEAPKRMAHALGEALAAVGQIEKMEGIRSVEFTSYKNFPALKLDLFDCAADLEGTRYLIPSFKAYLYITDKGVLGTHFPDNYYKAHNDHRYVHPHISREGSPCWGEATVMLQKSASTFDWVTLVGVFVRWVTTLSDDPHVPAHTHFKKTNLPKGWIKPTEANLVAAG